MDERNRTAIIEELVSTIEISDSAYETAEKRYKDLGKWFGRPESRCADYSPHIYSQGSFCLGTVIHPLDPEQPYDLDLSCSLRQGFSKFAHSQEELKTLVGLDVEGYRTARGIESPKEEKHRCWRLEYADSVKFHLDITPCIPELGTRTRLIESAMIKMGAAESLAHEVTNLTVNLTDTRHINYRNIVNDWNVSNPIGFARWFESRMKLATLLMEKRFSEAKAARVDDLPTFKWKTPLQRTVQLLKRHRDVMFKDDYDSKPTSIIITTLAGRAYQGESDLGDAIHRCLADMGGLVSAKSPRIPNPVNPAEDFADKWSHPENRAKKLEENFWLWLKQAKIDFEVIGSSNDVRFVEAQALQKFGSRLDPSNLRDKLGVAAPFVHVPSKTHNIVETPPRPWSR